MNKIGIIGAMEEQLISLKRKVIVNDTIEKAGMTFYRGHVGETEVILVRCQNGKVSAAVCTQILIDVFEMNTIINIGLAGGMHPNLQIGDVIIASDTQEREGLDYFINTNRKLVKDAKEAAQHIVDTPKSFEGLIRSDDQFVGSIGLKDETDSTFVTYCADMEGAAIAHTCFLNSIPFVAVRTISDKADQQGEMNFEEFVHLVVRNESKIVEKIIESM